MKVIFLDFDGVLNSDLYTRLHRGESITLLNPDCLDLLRTVVESTDAKIVLSTSWRDHWEPDESACDPVGQEIHRVFADHGMRIYGKTGKHRIPDVRNIYLERSREILDWLSAHPDVETYLVLDDYDLTPMGIPPANMLKTSGHVGGLTPDNAALACERLGGLSK